jgi:hypothetical protein
LDNVDSVQEALIEANKTQQTLIELVELRAEFEKAFNNIDLEFEKFMADRRVSVKKNLDKNSVKNITKDGIDNQVIAIYQEEYSKLKEKHNQAKLNSDLCLDLRMIMFQRKDIIYSLIEYLKVQKDRESCVINSKEFIEKILGRIS